MSRERYSRGFKSLGIVAAVAVMLVTPMFASTPAQAKPVKTANTMMGLTGTSKTVSFDTGVEITPPNLPARGDEVLFDLNAFVVFGGDILSNTLQLAFSVYDSATDAYVPVVSVDTEDELTPGEVFWSCTPITDHGTGLDAAMNQAPCTAVYMLTDEDAAGGVLFQIIVSGSHDDDFIHSNGASPLTLGEQYGAMVMTKDVSPKVLSDDGTLTYTFTVTYYGTTELDSNPMVKDPMISSTAFECADDVDTTTAGETVYTCTKEVPVTIADYDGAGVIHNVAVASGSVGSKDMTATDYADAFDAVLVMDKTASTEVAHAGDPITYTFEIGNPGGVTVDNVDIDDTFGGTGPITFAGCGYEDYQGNYTVDPMLTPGTISLAPGDVVMCVSDPYTVTPDDAIAGTVTNSAVATGTYDDQQGNQAVDVASVADEADVAIEPPPAIGLSEGVDQASVSVNDQVVFTYTITNLSPHDMNNIKLTETSFSGLGTPPVFDDMVCTREVVEGEPFAMQSTDADGTLAPGAKVVCVLPPYTTVPGDAAQGTVTSKGVATGDEVGPGGGGATSAEISSFTLVATGSGTSGGGAGGTSAQTGGAVMHSGATGPVAVSLLGVAIAAAWLIRRRAVKAKA